MSFIFFLEQNIVMKLKKNKTQKKKEDLYNQEKFSSDLKDGFCSP
jgi:hypothetical protein